MEIKNFAVIGCGTMGKGIIQVAATSGFNVYGIDTFPKAIESAQNSIEKGIMKWVEKGKISEEEGKKAINSICYSEDLSSLKVADFVVEAIVEKEEEKKKLFKELDGITRDDVILASNTSSISITTLGKQTKKPDKVIGMHFMNPVPLMSLVEIIKGYDTSQETVKFVIELAKKMGKVPVEAKDSPGFISNRVLMPMINEAIFCLYEGIGTKEDIDTVMKLGMNHPMGPLALADLIGLDVCLDILNVLYEGFKDPK
ncbi:MAG: 3-hydroxyacyl-CoA dehydrogenase NAD-binding domain-containing protein [Thermoanaerobaculia bacterium]